ncbi:MAG: hypothetical protein IPM82_19990 [Saprospiraceae bacterium]|nr:hypothetical protein [Saprospiraceae bacterium]
MYPQSKYRSKLYRDYRAIEPGEWRKVVHFYEEKEAEIRGLDFDEYFELMNAYTNALFEIGAWQKHLLMADAVIEASINENISELHGEDVFQHTLFRKSASHYQLNELERTEYILRELLRINPHHADASLFLKKCLRTMRPWLVRQTRAVAMLLTFVAAFAILLEILVVRNFYENWTRPVEYFWWGILALAALVLAAGEVFHYGRCNREVDNFLRGVRARRRNY